LTIPGELVKLASYTVALISVLSAMMNMFYDRYVGGFVDALSLASITSLVFGGIFAYIMLVHTKLVLRNIRHLKQWFFGHIVTILTGVHPNVESELNRELKTFERHSTQHLQYQFDLHLKAADRLVKAEVERRLNSWRPYVVGLPIPNEIIVPARSNRFYEFRLDMEGKNDLKLCGELNVYGDGEQTIKFYLFDQHNFMKFTKNAGIPFRPLDESPHTTNYLFNVPITHSGKYYLLFDNSHTSTSSKSVKVSATLHFKALAKDGDRIDSTHRDTMDIRSQRRVRPTQNLSR